MKPKVPSEKARWRKTATEPANTIEVINGLRDCVRWLMERHGKDTQMICDTCGWHYMWDEPTCPNCKRLREQEEKRNFIPEYCCLRFREALKHDRLHGKHPEGTYGGSCKDAMKGMMASNTSEHSALKTEASCVKGRLSVVECNIDAINKRLGYLEAHKYVTKDCDTCAGSAKSCDKDCGLWNSFSHWYHSLCPCCGGERR